MMPPIHMTVAAVIERDNRFLLVEEIIDGQRVFNQPAGHLEIGESLPTAVCREVYEETGWKFSPLHLVGIYRWHNPTKNATYLRVTFSGELHDTAVVRGPLDVEIVATHWLTLKEISELNNLRSPMVLRCIRDYLDGQRHALSLFQDID